MVKLIAITLILTLTSAYKTTPEELREIWTRISQELNDRQGEAQSEIQSITSILITQINVAKRRIVTEVNVAIEDYQQDIACLEEEAKSEDKNISSCIDMGNKSILKLDRDTIRNCFQAIDKSAEAEAGNVSNAAEMVEKALENLGQLTEQVDACEDTDCAESIENIVVGFYNNTIEDLAKTVNSARKAALIDLPLELAVLKVDTVSYQQTCSEVLANVTGCIIEVVLY